MMSMFDLGFSDLPDFRISMNCTIWPWWLMLRKNWSGAMWYQLWVYQEILPLHGLPFPISMSSPTFETKYIGSFQVCWCPMMGFMAFKSVILINLYGKAIVPTSWLLISWGRLCLAPTLFHRRGAIEGSLDNHLQQACERITPTEKCSGQECWIFIGVSNAWSFNWNVCQS